MLATKSWASISLPLSGKAHRRNGSEVPPASERGENPRQAWQRLIDATLMAWSRNPAQLEDDGIDPPKPELIKVAIDLAEKYRDEGSFPPPDTIVPDPNGGIVFERRESNVSEVLHVWEGGTVEYMLFEDARLVERRAL